MKTLLRIVSITLLCLCMASCCNKPKAKHVILLGLDGMSSADFVADEMPTVKELMNHGCLMCPCREIHKGKETDVAGCMLGPSGL